MTYKTTIKGKEFNIEVASQDSRSLNIKVENDSMSFNINVDNIFKDDINNIELNILKQSLDKLIFQDMGVERLI